MKTSFRYIVNTVIFLVFWALLFLPSMKYSIDYEAMSIAAIGGVVGIFISYRLVKRINKSKLWAKLFNVNVALKDVVKKKEVDVKEEYIEKKVEVEEEKKQDGNIYDTTLPKGFKIFIASIFFICFISFFYTYINNKLKDKKYCNSERSAESSMYFTGEYAKERNPDYKMEVELKYVDGIVSYKAKISDNNYKPDSHIWGVYDNEGKREGTYEFSGVSGLMDFQDFENKMALKGLTIKKEGKSKRPDDDITKTYLYELAEGYRSISMDVELLDKEGFLLKEFTINNFKLEDETVYLEGYSSHNEKFLIAKGNIEMSQTLFKKISCYKRSCNDCEKGLKKEPSGNIKLSVSY